MKAIFNTKIFLIIGCDPTMSLKFIDIGTYCSFFYRSILKTIFKSPPLSSLNHIIHI